MSMNVCTPVEVQLEEPFSGRMEIVEFYCQKDGGGIEMAGSRSSFELKFTNF